MSQNTFDIFLSYRSTDSVWANNLREALETRGVSVWLDKKQIRPGDLFVRALEQGLNSSRAVGLVVTPESLDSGWVEEEYARAMTLAAEKQVKLIPILLRGAPASGFLGSREHVDFRDHKSFDQAVDRLVWPGLTGRRISFFAMHSTGTVPWKQLAQLVAAKGLDFHASDYVETAERDVAQFCRRQSVVVVADLFEGWPWRNSPGRSPSKYWASISALRRNRDNVFMLYHHPDALQTAPTDLSPDTIADLRRFFTLPQVRLDDRWEQSEWTDEDIMKLHASFLDLWVRAQRELLQRLRRHDA